MKFLQLPFSEVDQFAPTDVAYSRQEPQLISFAKYSPDLKAFRQAIEDRKKNVVDRALLLEVVQNQYQTYITDSQLALSQVKLLQLENTFTVVTAHQPVLFTGPAYVAYKIVSAVKLTQLLTKEYPDYNFVPVFVVGGEDHDFEEMNHTSLYGKTIQWENDEAGSVGRMRTLSLKSAIVALREILGESNSAQEICEMVEKTHTHHEKYGQAFADLLNGLFGHLGLVVINMDEPRFKRRMISIFKDELLNHHSATYVKETQKALEQSGFAAQAYVREINLFYLTEGIRNRIEKTGDVFHIVDTKLQFTQEEILKKLEENPEQFSPNVVIRPLYQEKILPNLAYVGGGGELAYWLERKQQFEFFGINFPVLIRRDSCLFIDKSIIRKMHKLELDILHFCKSESDQIKEYVSSHAEHEFSLDNEKIQIEKLWLEIEEKARVIDPTLKASAAAEGKSQIKALEKFEDRLRRTEKQKHEVALGQIKSIREKIYPGNGLQERTTNYLEFYLRDPENYFTILLEHFDPLNMQLKILFED